MIPKSLHDWKFKTIVTIAYRILDVSCTWTKGNAQPITSC